MWCKRNLTIPNPVALHPEGVDRNSVDDSTLAAVNVALHPEGVDRNHSMTTKKPPYKVALHPEGVDRNLLQAVIMPYDVMSPSTRRAWIEMITLLVLILTNSVALHPEGVDRNFDMFGYNTCTVSRPPPGGRG